MNLQALQEAFESVESLYKERGIFRYDALPGKKPALVIVDMAYGWTDPAYPCGSARLDEAVKHIQTLLPACRAAGIPIIYTTAYFHAGQTDPALTRPESGTSYRSWDERACEIDARLEPLPGELVIRKESDSAFFGTPLAAHFIGHSIDTVIVTGCSTSACIRATVTDARAYRFNPIVPRECVQDRAEAAHLWNLADLSGKFGVVMPTAQVLDYIRNREKTAT